MDKLLLEEQEVSINFTRLDDFATIYASDITWIRKMDKLCEECPDAYECIAVAKTSDGTIVGKTYKFPKKLISPRKPMKQENVSEEVKKVRMQNLSKSKKDKVEN